MLEWVETSFGRRRARFVADRTYWLDLWEVGGKYYNNHGDAVRACRVVRVPTKVLNCLRYIMLAMHMDSSVHEDLLQAQMRLIDKHFPPEVASELYELKQWSALSGQVRDILKRHGYEMETM